MASDWQANNKVFKDNESSTTPSPSNGDAAHLPDYDSGGSAGGGDGKECTVGTESITSTEESHQHQSLPFSSFDNLPDIAIKEILKNIDPDKYFENFDRESFSSHRLVCVRWNEVIKNTSELMKRITFPIRNLKGFLNLKIVKQRKVKSIIFNKPLKYKQLELNEESNIPNLEAFMNLISNTIEIVTFKLDKDLLQQSQLLQLVLTKCNNLQEINVNNNRTWNSMYNNETSLGIFYNITKDIEIAAANKITSISVNLTRFKEEDGIGLTSLLMKLPQLEKISLFGDYISPETATSVYNVLHQYMEKYEKELRLKNLDLKCDSRSPTTEYDQARLVLLIMCAKYGLLKENAFRIDFNSLLEFTDRPAVHSIRPLFPMKIDGVFDFNRSPSLTLSNSFRFIGLNINHLQVNFRRDITDGEFGWIRNIQSLKSLRLSYLQFAFFGNPRWLGPTSIEELHRVFATGIHSLMKLQINVDIFIPSVGFHWAQYFPNLKELYLKSCKFTPDHFIVELTFLQSLEHLDLTSLPNLRNRAFTIECVNQFGNDNASSSSLMSAPAITCFKSLKFLQVAHCPLLTDDCVVNGISKSNTLETVNLMCENISLKSRNYVTYKY